MEVIRANQDRLLDELFARADEFEGAPEGQQATLVLLRSLDAERFAEAWRFFWGALPPRHPKLAGAASRAAAWSPEHNGHLRTLLSVDVVGVYTAIPDEVVYALMHARPLADVRDRFLARILEAGGLDAAKRLIHGSRYQNPPRVLLNATKLVLERDPHDKAAPAGVALCLELDPDAVVATIVAWMNAEREDRHIDHSDLSWRLPDHAARLLPALADDAVKRPRAWHSVLAQMHHFRLRNNAVIADWLEGNIDREEATEYAASLLIEALSAMHETNDEALAKRLHVFAKRLHARAGTTSEENLILFHGLGDPGLKDRENLIAIALAKEVRDPPEPVDRVRLLKNIQAYPRTHAALGGPILEKELAAGRLPAHLFKYRHDLDAQQKELDEERDKGLLSADHHKWLWDHWEGVRRLRAEWESLFMTIADAGVKITPGYSRRLREDPHIWNEIRILARLVGHFNVTLEPKNLPGMGKKAPEFLLESPDGTLIFELATIGEKPSDLRTGIKSSAGGEAKRILNRKVVRQFGESKTGITLPVVLGIQVQYTHDLEFDLLNSLYGPLAASWAMHKDTGEVVSEGPTRHVEKAFFAQDNVGCVSAVAGIAPENRQTGHLLGKLHRPLKEPDRPLSLPLWVRLRTALYGPRPPELIDEMCRIPNITLEEANAMVDAGLDDPAFLAAERFEKPASLSMEDTRWRELLDAAQHRQLLASTNAIRDLRAAKGADLSPLDRERIYRIKQLYGTPRPQDFPVDVWAAMTEEAERYLGRPQDRNPAD